jgi:hypothetical protein
MHAALAAWWAQPGAGSELSPQRSAAVAAASVQLRLASADRVVPADARAPAVLAPASAPGDAPGEAPRLMAPALPVDVDPIPESMAPLERPAVELLASVTPAPNAGFDEQSYLPRPRLTVPPTLQSAVLLSWPPHDAPPAGRYAGVLSLFIDELGVVQRVRVDEGELPAALQEQARAVFLGAHFSPGQLQGQVVKSRIRIEVSFEADPRAQRKGISP